MKRLKNKVAVVYGDGTVGSAVAKAFSAEGAKVFFTGRTAAKLNALAKESLSESRTIETAELDALDEHSVAKHMREVIKNAGQIDISFNAIGIPSEGIQDIPLTELSVENFFLPITIYVKSHFITTKVAANQMIKQGNGVILMHTPSASHISPPFSGGRAPAWAALEALCRSLSVECGKSGVRSVCLLTSALPETPLINEVWKIHAETNGITLEQFRAMIEGNTHRKRLTTLKELTDAAVFAASDQGSAITGTILNLTAGMIV